MMKCVFLHMNGAMGMDGVVGISPPLMPSYARTTLSGIIKTVLGIMEAVWGGVRLWQEMHRIYDGMSLPSLHEL